ncbi:DUF4411 family protein [Halomonas sp. McH1-25]|uniref:DUF4411 family protein n=1 Tax=unclassified Halomonas TaxID=2609666 RepID=UPI001EF4839E|nr:MULTISPECIES: DUF4411 family protein [unclassified Halomonas]MCG7598418.1 DUF4411 family protein [Halomonas sp. McH1-25]MCP1343754.1 DUF4411 family protein [Halomonas sp. FL8]MCP1361733.1 DUF4411 family protein [Halomonas sp. BBD45]MCP1363999.1 DUF4411 family protein [Halomonas sp. BBD48]
MPVKQKELFLLDANVIIHAHDLYYHMDRVPEFWDWIEFHAANGSIAMPYETHDEIKGGANAQHVQWARRRDVRDRLVLDEEFDPVLLNRVIQKGYAPDLNEVELEKIAMDPFLVAYGLRDPANRIVVSNEVSKPSKKRANRKVPDVCSAVGVRCCNVYQLLRELDFRTDWRSAV